MDKVDTVQHKKLSDGKWAEMPFRLQMANIGSEISRAIKWKNRDKKSRMESATYRALELIDFSIKAAQNEKNKCNKGKVKELCRAREEICDFFLGDNEFQTRDEVIMRYYDGFALLGR